jgi:hypothetical protein
MMHHNWEPNVEYKTIHRSSFGKREIASQVHKAQSETNTHGRGCVILKENTGYYSTKAVPT